uniref:Olfactomedin-like domain-containing protein n=1 Tax=Arion vulgaris TaxID=1028688 RepID=A0A0B7B8Z5_9EUPU
MHLYDIILVIINIGLLILVCELPQCHVGASDVSQGDIIFDADNKPLNTNKDQTKFVSRMLGVNYLAKKDAGIHSSINKFKKSCKCVCPYQANTAELKKCAVVEPPTPPTPSSNNSSVSDVPSPPLHVNGIFPSLAATAASGPDRTECGTGALMPWADKLYMVSYLSVPDGGNGTGLYAIDDKFTITKLADHRSTFANRILHRQTNQIIIGAWAIDMEGRYRVFPDLLRVRIGASAEHLTHPETMVYMLGMDGPLWECNVTSLECSQLFDLVKTLNIPASAGEQPHFKAAHTMNGRLLVASNTFEANDFTGQQHGGRLAEWKGPGTNWTILEETAFVEVTGRRNFGQVIYALGWDFRSVILKVFDPANNYWQTYRLPKGSHAFDHLWQTEWPRIREVETERYLMDMHGLFYELSPLGWAGSTWGIRPISQHIRVIPDFTSFRGLLVLGGNQVSSIFDNNVVTGQAQSGLWFGKTDDLWSFGKPQGWGAVWRADNLANGSISDPYLMTGFDKKVMHIILHDNTPGATVTLEVDVTGTAGHRVNENWLRLYSYTLSPSTPYTYYIFQEGYSVHWVRTRVECIGNPSCTVTAYFHYT